ncbi:MAG: YesL family protein [Oscillospiraceae bacterium]|nr:YesL family protein [Oscillospiraceae bacterium]
MDRRFNLKASFWGGLRTLGDLMILNWLWFFTSLPIITVGPATCAMYTVTLKLTRGEHAAPVRDYFRAFRDNFKKGLVLGLIAIAFVLVAYVDYRFALAQTGLFNKLYLALAILIGSLGLTFIAYAFPLQAMFENPLKKQIKNTFALSVSAPGKTLMMWLILVFPVAALLLPQVVLAMLGFLYLIFGFSGPAYLNSRILRNLFDKVNGSPVRPLPEDENE